MRRAARISLFAFVVATACLAQTENFRPPAVPLVPHDPYFSIWSMADHLTDQPTKHWTGVVQSTSSLIRIDGQTYRVMGSDPRRSPALPQTGVEVLPTHTTYQFTGAGIQLSLTFFTPALPQDLEVLSRPVTYLRWEARSTDANTHQVAIYFDAASQVAVNSQYETVQRERYRLGNLQVLRMGTREQPILQKSGDDLRIDWGYFYVVAPAGDGANEAVTVRPDAMKFFASSGHVPEDDDLDIQQPYGQPMPVLAASFDLGTVSATPVSRFLMVAYDDLFSIEYFERRLRPYWRRNGTDIAHLIHSALDDYQSLNQRGEAFDRELMADLRRVGGEH